MRKVQEWEYNHAMHDYLKWQDELEKLLNKGQLDEESIRNAKEIIADYEDALFQQQ